MQGKENRDVNDQCDVNYEDDSGDDPTWNPNNESLSESEGGNDRCLVEVQNKKETLEDRYYKIKSEIESEQPPDKSVLVVNRRLFKVRINDLLFSEHYRQLRDCVLQNRVQKMSDIDKMLHGERVDEREAVQNDKRFRKQHRDTQLLRELCITEKFLNYDGRNREEVSEVPAQEKVELTNQKDISHDEERLLEDW